MVTSRRWYGASLLLKASRAVSRVAFPTSTKHPKAVIGVRGKSETEVHTKEIRIRPLKVSTCSVFPEMENICPIELSRWEIQLTEHPSSRRATLIKNIQGIYSYEPHAILANMLKEETLLKIGPELMALVRVLEAFCIGLVLQNTTGRRSRIQDSE